jgi:hypothetical protein
MTKELIINALLAGFWAGLAAFSASQELSKTALFAAVAVAVRAIVGYLANASGRTIPVDK